MYATVDDMIARFKTAELIQLTDEAELGSIDSARVTTALTRASNEVDSYLAGTYQLPLSPAPAALVDYTCDIARYHLYGDAAGEAVKTRYDAAIDWLKLVSKGGVKLQVAGTEPVATLNSILTDDSVVACKRDQMRGY